MDWYITQIILLAYVRIWNDDKLIRPMIGALLLVVFAVAVRAMANTPQKEPLDGTIQPETTKIETNEHFGYRARRAYRKPKLVGSQFPRHSHPLEQQAAHRDSAASNSMFGETPQVNPRFDPSRSRRTVQRTNSVLNLPRRLPAVNVQKIQTRPSHTVVATQPIFEITESREQITRLSDDPSRAVDDLSANPRDDLVEILPEPDSSSSREHEMQVEPIFEEALSTPTPMAYGFPHGSPHPDRCDRCGPLGWIHQLFASENNSTGEIGIGRERLPLAPMIIDVTQPMRNNRYRLDVVENMTLCDRSERFWPRSGGIGPDSETSVNYQDFRFMMERGGARFSVQTDVGFRVLDPVENSNTAGFSDMSIATKAVILDGKRWQLTNWFRTEMPTGAIGKGLSTGHVSLEPGILARYQWTETTYFHGEAKVWIGLPGHPLHVGQVVQYGFAISHLYYETDTIALIPTLEFLKMNFLDGQKTVVTRNDEGVLEKFEEEVDGDEVVHLYPGFRFVADTGCDFGLFEFGFAAGIPFGMQGWYETLIRFDMRWSF